MIQRILIACIFFACSMSVAAQTRDSLPTPPKGNTGIKPYNSVITKNAKTSVGLFTVHKIDEKYSNLVTATTDYWLFIHKRNPNRKIIVYVFKILKCSQVMILPKNPNIGCAFSYFVNNRIHTKKYKFNFLIYAYEVVKLKY